MPDDERSARDYWEELARNAPPRTAEVVGTKCASTDCHVTSGITYDKPLCYPCWTAYDGYEIDECPRCHWFVDELMERGGEQRCLECAKGEDVPVYDHAQIERWVRYLYILKLDGGRYYVGQTNDLELRLQEHRDGLTRSTKGQNPSLAYFEERRGDKAILNEQEEHLTRLNQRNPRAIRRIVAEWQRLIRHVKVEPIN